MKLQEAEQTCTVQCLSCKYRVDDGGDGLTCSVQGELKAPADFHCHSYMKPVVTEAEETIEQALQRIAVRTQKATDAYFNSIIVSPEWGRIKKKVMESMREEAGKVMQENLDTLLLEFRKR